MSLLQSILYFGCAVILMITLGALTARPDTRSNRWLQRCLGLHFLWLLLSFAAGMTTDPNITFWIWRKTVWIYLFSGLVFSAVLKDRESPTLRRFHFFLSGFTVLAALLYGALSLYSRLAVSAPLPGSIEIGLSGIAVVQWSINLYATRQFYRSIPVADIRQRRSILLMTSGVALVLILAAIIPAALLMACPVERLFAKMPLMAMAYVPLMLLAIHRYDFLQHRGLKTMVDVFETTSEGFVLLTPDCLVEQMNPAAASMLGLQRRDAVHVPVSRWLPDIAGIPENEKIVVPVGAETDDPRFLQIGRNRICRGSRFVGWLLVIRDVTVERQADALLAQTAEDLEQTIQDRLDELRHLQEMEALGLMAGSIAHDFNNQIAVIRNFTGAVMMDLSPEDPARRRLQRGLEVTEKCRGIVDQLLFFSRPGTTPKNPVVLQHLISNILPLIRSAFTIPIFLRLHLPDNPVEVMGNERDLAGALMNLCTNAHNAMVPAGGGVMEIRVEIDEGVNLTHYQGASLNTSRKVGIIVTDTGRELTSEIAQLAFEPFYTTSETAIGLGLSITLRIAVNHLGGVFLRPAPGGGCEAGLVLPRIRQPEDVEAAESQAPTG